MYLTRKQTLALAILVSLALIGGGVLIRRHGGGVVTVTAPAADTAEEAGAGDLTIHVCGAVRNPGVFVLPAGSRVYEAIEMAGGALPEANLEAVNLAARLIDGEQIFLPKKGEKPPPGVLPPENSSSAPPPAAASAEPQFPLHLNRASAEELDALPGIGMVIAARIVAYRQDNGPYTSVDDLLNVSGIGLKTLDRIRSLLVIP